MKCILFIVFALVFATNLHSQNNPVEYKHPNNKGVKYQLIRVQEVWLNDTNVVPNIGYVEKKLIQAVNVIDTFGLNYDNSSLFYLSNQDYLYNVTPFWYGDTGKIRLDNWIQPIYKHGTMELPESVNQHERAMSQNAVGIKQYLFMWSASSSIAGAEENYFDVISDTINGCYIFNVDFDVVTTAGVGGMARVNRSSGNVRPYHAGDTYQTSSSIYTNSTTASFTIQLAGLETFAYDTTYDNYKVGKLTLKMDSGNTAQWHYGVIRVFYIQNIREDNIYSEWGIKLENI